MNTNPIHTAFTYHASTLPRDRSPEWLKGNWKSMCTLECNPEAWQLVCLAAGGFLPWSLSPEAYERLELLSNELWKDYAQWNDMVIQHRLWNGLCGTKAIPLEEEVEF